MNPEWLDLSIDMIDEEDIEELSIEIDKACKGEGNLDSDIKRNSIRF